MHNSLQAHQSERGVSSGTFTSVDTAAQEANANGARRHVLLLANTSFGRHVVQDHIAAIRGYSRHRVTVVNPTELRLGWSVKWSNFDAVIIHYSICILFDKYLPPPLREFVRRFRGPKIQIIQDECRWVNRMTREIADLGINAVFSSLTLENLPRVYHHDCLRGVRFYSSLPGYVAERYLDISVPRIADRRLHLVYRGQQLAPWYGKGAKEKHEIGKHALSMAAKFGLAADIKTREEDRVFGDGWVRHLTLGKAVLGTEGGVSVFDFDESAEKGAREYMALHPEASWDEVWERVVRPYEGNIVHRTITPRIFESILCRTALVLYPGDFRGHLEPWQHYIPLARDASNESEVARLLRDDSYLQKLVDRAHAHVVADPALQFAHYVAAIDVAIDHQWRLQNSSRPQMPLAFSPPRKFVESLERLWLAHEPGARVLGFLKRIGLRLRRLLGLAAIAVIRPGELMGAIRFARMKAPNIAADGAPAEPMNVLVIGDFWSRRISTVRDHLAAFRSYSRNRICFVTSRTHARLGVDFSVFDVLVLHYSVIITNESYISSSLADQIRNFRGYKVLFIQDEYRGVDRTVAAIADLGVDVVYSAVNEDVRDLIYYHETIRDVRRKTTFTGFVPEDLTSISMLKYEERGIDVGYRTCRQRASLGATGQEKWRIGEYFKRDAGRYGLTCDIEYQESKRIYGSRWVDFVMNCKAMLGSESSVSFIDFDGTMQPRLDAYEDAHPHETAAEIQAKFLGTDDGKLVINVISPRCFEAAALRTLMILYPGRYSGILQPWRHYVPLERDHSNMDEVVALLRDPHAAQRMIDAAYYEVALNPKYSFREMVADFDRDLQEYAWAKTESGKVGVMTLGGDAGARAQRAHKLLHLVEWRSLIEFYSTEMPRLIAQNGVYRVATGAIKLLPERYRTPVMQFTESVVVRIGLRSSR